MFASPFTALNAQGSGLEASPPSLEPLRERMAEIYGVEPYQLMVTRGASHATEILMRRLKVNGYETLFTDPCYSERHYHLQSLADAYGLTLKQATKPLMTLKGAGMYLIDNPNMPDGKVWDVIAARTLAVEVFPALLVIDESYFDVCDGVSLVELTKSETNVVVLKSLSFLYGLSGARVGALISSPKTLNGMSRFCEPAPLPTPSIRAAEAALAPSRALNVQSRVDLIRTEQARLREALTEAPSILQFHLNDGPYLFIKPKDLIRTQTALKRFGVVAKNAYEGLIMAIGDKPYNDRLLNALGVSTDAGRPARRGEVLRDTKETKISAIVDLDNPKPVKIHTGVGFFDHMLDQVATHGGFSLQLSCEGDLEIDAHHTIEDCMLAFGAALKSALGDRIGMARFGFVLPTDETEARVSVDISGRAYCVFKGEFDASHIGDYPTEMTGHAFRSLSEALGASIHVEVTGENDHHKVEACFKALGRALRSATRIEGDALPSTKGMLA